MKRHTELAQIGWKQYLRDIDDDTDSPLPHEWSDAEVELQCVLGEAKFDTFLKDNDLLKGFSIDTIADENSPINAFFEGLVGHLTPEQFNEAIGALTRIGRARSIYYVTHKKAYRTGTNYGDKPLPAGGGYPAPPQEYGTEDL
jgi:hypothetical protein